MSARKGIVLSGEDKAIQARAKQGKLPVTVDAGMPLAYEKTLFVTPGARVPWELLPAAWHFLERWDAALPLWRYGTNASDVGTPSERKRTQKVIRDLRVLLHAVELLFVRDNDAGRALVAAFNEERADGGEARLAFLRAFYRVKPRLCVLPRSWLAEVQQFKAPKRFKQPSRLVQVEIGPGRFVRCRPENVEQVREQFAKMTRRRRAR